MINKIGQCRKTYLTSNKKQNTSKYKQISNFKLNKYSFSAQNPLSESQTNP